MKSRPTRGSHPEESYVLATRKRMFLDRPTSHGGWPEGEYDPPVRDRIYSWYKSMGMMPESDEEYVDQTGDEMLISERDLRRIISEIAEASSSEEVRDTVKQRAGHKLGYSEDPISQKLAEYLARDIEMSDAPDTTDAFKFVEQNPEISRNVWSNLQSAGLYDLAALVKPLIKNIGPRGA
jgi:hypothetical protein